MSADWTGYGDEDSGYFGTSVATAGDVNGDGHSDLIVGAYRHDAGAGAGADRGRAYVYLGSGGRPATTPGWIVSGDQNFGYFGNAVASAGDVNGDGYSDVIVGAANQMASGNGGAGQAYLYLGTENGLATTPAWTGSGDEPNASYGLRVSTAGDVNGDGYSDVLVGAQYHNAGPGNNADRGRAYLYLGSSLGLATTPAWVRSGTDLEANFGASVATAGDVNGDGYSDVIVGAPRHNAGDDLFSYRGQAYVYLGSGSGLATIPAWTASGDERRANFGFSVASAGDVNGDGYSDVLVGANFHDGGGGTLAERGRAYLYLGGPGGLAATPTWTVTGDEDLAELGGVVASAGDVNGDGYADVVIAAARHNAGGTDRGRAYVYLGSASGLSTSPSWTGSGSVDNAAFGRSAATAGDPRGLTPAGRGKVRLQWESKPLGTPFDGTSLGSSFVQNTGAPGGSGSSTPFDEAVSATEGRFYHWRMRVVTSDPFFPRSPWISMTGNSITESKLRTAGCVDRDGDGAGDFSDPSCSLAAPDCNPLASNAWETPGEATNVRFTSKTSLTWDAPAAPGAPLSALVYDTLRTGFGVNFGLAACLDLLPDACAERVPASWIARCRELGSAAGRDRLSVT